MKRHWIGLVGVCSWILFAGCGGKQSETPQPAAKSGQGTQSEVHPQAASAKYACPMHPEETSDKPAKCGKCGMEMAPKDGAAQ